MTGILMEDWKGLSDFAQRKLRKEIKQPIILYAKWAYFALKKHRLNIGSWDEHLEKVKISLEKMLLDD